MNNKLYKLDLHTHSIISRDGGITADQYKQLLGRGILDCIAITDHNETVFAKEMHKQFGDRIIIGEEITTLHGEIIGLFLDKTIPAGLSVEKTIAAIHRQGGLVYIPHPFETQRKGLQRNVLQKIIGNIDIVETFNARGRWRGKAVDAESFAIANHLARAASSDAHGVLGTGTAFSLVTKIPNKQSIKAVLQKAVLSKEYAPLWTYLYPVINKLKHELGIVNQESGK